MGRFRRVAIRGYRSIEKADLRLGEITVVIGPTNTGKSNLVRALRDWAYGAVGSDFCTAGSSLTRVAVAVDHEHKILWTKHHGFNASSASYLLVNAETHQRTLFEKIGREVPPDVRAVTGIQEVEVDDLALKINFSEQDEPWFLLSSMWTPLKVSKVVGKVSGVDALILAHRDLVNARTAQAREGKSARDKADELRGQLGQYDTVDRQAGLIVEAEGRQQALVVAKRRLGEVSALVKRVSDQRARMPLIKQRAQLLGRALAYATTKKIVERRTQLDEAQRLLTAATGLANRKTQAASRAVQLQERVTQLVAELDRIAEDRGLRCPLCGGAAHPECRQELQRQAKGARR